MTKNRFFDDCVDSYYQSITIIILFICAGVLWYFYPVNTSNLAQKRKAISANMTQNNDVYFISENADNEPAVKNIKLPISDTSTSSLKTSLKVSSSTPQFVVISFDGSKSLEMWKETKDFAKKLVAEGKPIHFTYFINGAYFLTERTRNAYKGPADKVGRSPIGFSDSEKDITARINHVNGALEDGHEIGSHSAGHFNGKDWTLAEWQEEFDSFNKLIFNISANSAPSVFPALNLKKSDVVGFRAPDLGVNKNLYENLKNNNFLYDASGIGLAKNWPTKDEFGIWHIPLGTIYLGKEMTPAIAMDYSIWILQSKGEHNISRNNPLWDKDMNDVKNAYISYFENNYKGNRAPVIIGHHFSKWNDGMYWEALKAFAEETCGKSNVKCVSFKELVNYLNKN